VSTKLALLYLSASFNAHPSYMYLNPPPPGHSDVSTFDAPAGQTGALPTVSTLTQRLDWVVDACQRAQMPTVLLRQLILQVCARVCVVLHI